MTTSLDAEDSTESKELVKIEPLHLKFLRNIHIFAFAVLIFWQFSGQNKSSFPASRLAIPILLLRFADRRKIKEPHVLEKVSSGCFGGGIRGEEVLVE